MPTARSDYPAAREAHAPQPQMMLVSPPEKALLLLIRKLGHGELAVIFRGGLPTYAEQVVERIHLGQWQGDRA